jgi:hypothetical protein
MAPPEKNLTPKQERAILAILSEPNREAAARASGVSLTTLNRWKRQPAFQEALRTARAELVEETLGLLQLAASGAVGALAKNLKCGRPSTEVAAALGILDRLVRSTELFNFAARLEELERQVLPKRKA